jgi:hypothetical protein
MKPRTIVLIVLACLIPLAVQIGLGVLVLGGGILFDEAVPAPRLAGNFGNNFVVDFPDAFPAAPQGQPCTREEVEAARGPVAAVKQCTFSGPFTHDNLAVFLVHGANTIREVRVMPLQSALEQNLAVVHEGALSIDNRTNVPIFIQAGDIVKGGTQDRVFPYDYLVPVGQTRLPVNVFCVESGRSFPRGVEVSTSFASSTQQLPGKRLNLAARHRHAQGEVWDGVRQLQAALERNAGGSVQSPQSLTSLQLTLETDRVQQAIQGYLQDLAPVTAGENEVIGVAFAVNGQIQSAEIYASSSLFLDLWPKLLRANAVAALAEKQPNAAQPNAAQPNAAQAPTVDMLQKFLAVTEEGRECRKETINGTLTLRQETAQALLYDTCDPTRQNLVLHRSFLAR